MAGRWDSMGLIFAALDNVKMNTEQFFLEYILENHVCRKYYTETRVPLFLVNYFSTFGFWSISKKRVIYTINCITVSLIRIVLSNECQMNESRKTMIRPSHSSLSFFCTWCKA